MKDNVLKTALREAVSRDFASIPRENEIDCEISTAFTHKMNRLTKSERSKLWRLTNTAPKRAAAILVALMLITITGCSIPAVRSAVFGFIKEAYENCIRLFIGEAGSKKISEHYELTEVPEDFIKIDTADNDAAFITVYQNEAGDKIILTQSITDEFGTDIDNEHGNLSEINLPGMNVLCYQSDGYMVAVWLQDQYAFQLAVYGNYDVDWMIQLIKSVRIQ